MSSLPEGVKFLKKTIETEYVFSHASGCYLQIKVTATSTGYLLVSKSNHTHFQLPESFVFEEGDIDEHIAGISNIWFSLIQNSQQEDPEKTETVTDPSGKVREVVSFLGTKIFDE